MIRLCLAQAMWLRLDSCLAPRTLQAPLTRAVSADQPSTTRPASGPNPRSISRRPTEPSCWKKNGRRKKSVHVHGLQASSVALGASIRSILDHHSRYPLSFPHRLPTSDPCGLHIARSIQSPGPHPSIHWTDSSRETHGHTGAPVRPS